MKLTKRLRGVRAGEIYPVWLETGDECPPELQAAAAATGALEQPETKKPAAKAKAEKATDAAANN